MIRMNLTSNAVQPGLVNSHLTCSSIFPFRLLHISGNRCSTGGWGVARLSGLPPYFLRCYPYMVLDSHLMSALEYLLLCNEPITCPLQLWVCPLSLFHMVPPKSGPTLFLFLRPLF